MGKKKRQANRSAEAPAVTGGSEMKKLYIVLAVVAVLVVVMVFGGGSGSLGGATARAPVDVAGLDDSQTLIQLAQGMTRGDPDAPVTVVEFADYQCPGCQAFAAMVEPQLIAGYVETGDVKFVLYDYPIPQLHPNAFLAARAARCAGDQDRYWDYHDMLFGNQISWSGSTNPANMFVGYAGQIGLDEGAFEDCVKSDRHAETVTANMRLGEELGVTGTPTVMVNRGGGMASRPGGNSYEAIAELIDQLLGRGTDDGGGRP